MRTKREKALRKDIETAVGGEQIIPALKRTRKQLIRQIKELIWQQEESRGRI